MQKIKSGFGFIKRVICPFALILTIGIGFSSCFEEEFLPEQNVELLTSVDTLRFDTVFTTVGSTTRGFKVINPTENNLIISSISLDLGAQSKFRLNIDGVSGNDARDIPILAGDSIYVFGEVTVDPDQPLSVSPFVIEEHITIRSGDAEKKVLLEAWGQNANYFPSRDSRGQIVGLSCNNGSIIWDDPKPYVINGLLFIDDCTLSIAPGTQVYVHGGVARTDDIIFDDGGLFFLEDGQLLSLGTVEEPIVFRTDRLEPEYERISGQWAGIRFLPGSTDNFLTNTYVLNSIVGVRVDSSAALTLENTIIGYSANAGLIGYQAQIKAQNTLIHSSGAQGIALVNGGEYDFDYVTVANYENQSPALYANNFECLDDQCQAIAVNTLDARFRNCILVGSNKEEVTAVDALDGSDPSVFQLRFEHSIVKIDPETFVITDDNCLNCHPYANLEPLFFDELEDDYRLDTMSVARDGGLPIDIITTDLLGVSRDATSPDLGCYEFQ